MYLDYSHWYKDDEINGQCPAVEVMKARDPQGFFATSHIPRFKRPREVKFRIGQVVKHLRHGYHGIIIGWDKTCKVITFGWLFADLY